MTARYSSGDHVYVHEHDRRRLAGGRVWEVVREDTNRTPVPDPEPAYMLRSAARAHGSWHVRYAYESCLVPAGAILANGDGYAQEVEIQAGGVNGTGHGTSADEEGAQEGTARPEEGDDSD